MKDKKQEPAFPSQEGYYFNSGDNSSSEIKNIPGMSLRDYFAAKAMQGILSGGQNLKHEYWPNHKEGRENISAIAYMQADAMLKEREK